MPKVDDLDLRRAAALYKQVLEALKLAREGRASRYSETVLKRFVASRLRPLMGDVPLDGIVDSLQRAIDGKPQDFVDRHFIVKVERKMREVIAANQHLADVDVLLRQEARAQDAARQLRTRRALRGIG